MMVGGGIVTLVLVLIVWLLGGDPMALLQQLQPGASRAVRRVRSIRAARSSPAQDPDDERRSLSRSFWPIPRMFGASNFGSWASSIGSRKLVLFSGATQSACGFAQSAIGPFYCPADSKVYLDTAFFRELEAVSRTGRFCQGVRRSPTRSAITCSTCWAGATRSKRPSRRGGKAEANKLSVRLELQADYLAGVWAHHAQRSRQILERGDIEAALKAATAIGDDRLQREARGLRRPRLVHARHQRAARSAGSAAAWKRAISRRRSSSSSWTNRSCRSAHAQESGIRVARVNASCRAASSPSAGIALAAFGLGYNLSSAGCCDETGTIGGARLNIVFASSEVAPFAKTGGWPMCAAPAGRSAAGRAQCRGASCRPIAR